MRVLIACEESQAVCIAFRERGHEAYSCDIQPCSGFHPEWHIQGDAIEVYHKHGPWDRVFSFQPCTNLTNSGARWFEEKRMNGSQEKSIRFFFEVWKISNCSENPVGILNGGLYVKKWFPKLYDEMIAYGFPFKPTQIIHPWQFGHGETKATCLWIRDLPELKTTNIVSGRRPRIHHMGPCRNRSILRSKTLPGVADAYATQWGAIQESVSTKVEEKNG